MRLLIQSDKPGSDQIGLELSIDDKRYVGLPANEPSYVIVSEVNLDRWPNPDMSLVPGRSNTFTDDRLASESSDHVSGATLFVEERTTLYAWIAAGGQESAPSHANPAAAPFSHGSHDVGSC